jgi:hypothetical protein
MGKKGHGQIEIEQVLSEQIITLTEPGTILKDFETLLEWTGSQGIPVSGKHNHFTGTVLPGLNDAMSRPIRTGLKRLRLSSCPNLAGLYLLLRVTGLTEVRRRGRSTRLTANEVMIRAWRCLNPTERYFTLLEAFFGRWYPEILGMKDSSLRHPLSMLLHPKFGQFQQDWPHGVQLASDSTVICLYEMFGIINVHPSGPVQGQGWRCDKIDFTDFGRALIATLEVKTDIDDVPAWIMEAVIGLEPPAWGMLKPQLQKCFPEWRNTLPEPEPEEHPQGTCVFKVSLTGAWRRLAVGTDRTFEALANAILDAFSFDHDHLYEFIARDDWNRSVHICHRYMEEPLFADDTTIGGLALKPGEEMIFRYDFGDEWHFRVKLEKLDSEGDAGQRPQLLDSRGKAPSQYDSWDEDD